MKLKEHFKTSFQLITNPAPLHKNNLIIQHSPFEALIPLFLFIVLLIGARIIIIKDHGIRAAVVEKQMSAIDEQFKIALFDGNIKPAEVEEQRKAILENIWSGDNSYIPWLIAESALLSIISFFLLYYFIYSSQKYFFESKIDAGRMLIAYGLSHYIFILKIIILLALSLLLKKALVGIDAAELFSVNRFSAGGFLLAKADPFALWFYTMLAVNISHFFAGKEKLKPFFFILIIWAAANAFVYAIFSGTPFARFMYAV